MVRWWPCAGGWVAVAEGVTVVTTVEVDAGVQVAGGGTGVSVAVGLGVRLLRESGLLFMPALSIVTGACAPYALGCPASARAGLEPRARTVATTSKRPAPRANSGTRRARCVLQRAGSEG